MNILRVFPRRTKATPTDDGVRIGYPGLFDEPVDEVHISTVFTYDLRESELLAKAWNGYGEVKVGGPGTGMAGSEFVGGMYLRHGYTITSRGCHNTCWYCDVWSREGPVRELPIVEGYNVLDDNLLACSEGHVRAVFDMLGRQWERVELTGGLEARILKAWHVDLIAKTNPRQVFFAYDKDGDLEPLREASRLFKAAGWPETPGKADRLRCYVLIGYDGDTMEGAEGRLRAAMSAGFLPSAMLYTNKKGVSAGGKWPAFQRIWHRPAIIKSG